MAKNKGGKKAQQHYCVGAGCKRNNKTVTLSNGTAKEFKSISKAKHFMRTGE